MSNDHTIVTVSRPVANDHTIVTASRPVAGAVRPDGAIHETRLVDLTQRALDDVRRLLELQEQPFRPDAVVVDVRVTAFVPAPQPDRRVTG